MNERIASDVEFTTVENDIMCKDCIYRDKHDFGNLKGYKKIYCDIYTEETERKPNEILWENATCKQYVKGD